MRTLGLLSAVGLTLLLPAAAQAAGDFNDDGFDDLAIKVPAEDIGALASAGAVSVLQGSAGLLTAAGDRFLHQDTAGFPDVAEAGDQFGNALATGDFNDDGFADLAIGVQSESVGAIAGAGIVHLLLGSAAGLTAAGNQIWNQDSGTVFDVAEAFDLFGAALAAGDFNSDGFDDLAIGVAGEAIGAVAAAGAVQVLPGSAAGLTDVGNQIWHQNLAFIPDAAEAGDQFGATLAAGDFNDDGFDDLAIGVHNESVGALGTAGVVHVLLGSAGGLTSTGNQLWSQNSGAVLDVAEADDEFGRALAAGDVNGDGIDDLAIGVPREDLGATTEAGAVNLLLGSAGGLTDAGNQLWHQDSAGVPDTAEAADQFGNALAAGDFDDDGFADLVIGVVGEDIGALASAGAGHVLPGSAAGLTSAASQFWGEDSPGVLGVAAGGDQFGTTLVVGDFDADGFPDLAIGVFGEDIGGIFSAGSVNLLPGSAGGLTAAGDQRWHQNSPGILDTAENGDNFGSF